MTAVFITGATGFIGRHLLPGLSAICERVVALGHKEAAAPAPAADLAGPGVHWVTGSLNNPSSYAAPLGECDTVIHLAARTGKSPRSLYRQINVEGTRALLQAAAQAGIRRFLHMSTIAAVYPDKAAYHYARSKEESEAVVRSASIPFTILRPTIIFGGGSVVEAALARLAASGRPVLFGDGSARLQPVHVGDVVAAVLAILEQGLFAGEAYDLGGPDVVSFDELMQRMHMAARRTAAAPPVRHLPARPAILLLSLLEKVMLPLLPLTAGQIYPFINDAVATPGALHPHLPPQQGLEEMLAALHGTKPAGTPGLTKECRVFCRYLIGRQPTDYIVGKYAEAHHVGTVVAGTHDRFQQTLVRFGGRGPLAARLADSYASLFCRRGLLRRKLVLLLAILESTAPTHTEVDTVIPGSRPGLLIRLGWRVAGFALAAALATLLLGPVHIAQSWGGGEA